MPRVRPALLYNPLALRIFTQVERRQDSASWGRAADARSLRGGAGPRERSASAAVQNLPAAAGRAARVAARPRLDATQPAAPAPSRAGRQLLDRESVLAASVGQPDREAPGGPESARSGDERLRPHPARRGAGRGAGGRHPSRVENNKLASASTSWLSRGPSPRAPGRRPPRASPSPGQSAASAALAGHIGLVLSHAGAELFSFKDRSPASEIHYLVIPKRFVRDAAQLGPADAELVRRMEAKAIELVRASRTNRFGITR